MKKHWKEWAGLLVCFAILATGLIVFFRNSKLILEQEHSTVVANLSDSLSEEDFVVLEVVPDKSYAQLGYLQEGMEPVDIFEACKDGKASDIAKIAGTGVKLVKTIDGTTYDYLKGVYGEEKMNKNWEQTSSGSAISSKRYTFKDGKEFVINQNSLANTLSFTLDADEKLVVKTVTATELKDATNDEVNALLDKTNFLYISESYVSEKEQKELANVSDAGKTFADSDLDWEAVKAIYERVADKEEPLPIMMDKTVYTDALNKSNKTVSTKQYELNRDVKYSKSSWETNGDLFRKTEWTAGSDKKSSDNNMYKLYLMTMFRDPAEFYNLFIESGLINNSGSYALQSGDAATYWNTYTFLPCKKEIKHADHEEGNESFWKSDMAITLSPQDGKWVNCNAISFQATTASSFTNAKSEIKNIFNYKPRSCMEGRTYHVLELEPAYHFSLSEAYIEQMLPYTSYSDGSSFKLKITEMTTAEYIGKTDDLASKYDLVYIGNDIKGLYTKEDTNGKTITEYGPKNEDMDGVIYAHVGAKVLFGYGTETDTSDSGGSGSNGVAFFDKGDSGSLRYSGNDITELKKTQLETFLDTGLPIVVADGLIEDAKKSKPTYFNDVSNNNMRNFLKDNEEDLLSLDFNYRKLSSQEANEQLGRLTKRKPTLTVNSLTAGSNTYTDLSKCNVYEFDKNSENRKFTFDYSVDNPDDPNVDFVLNFYVDKNADGRFIKSERVGTKRFKANGGSVNYTFSMNPNYTGAFTWKVEVYPANNTGMVCSQVGYSTIRFTNNDVNKRTVHVLQVQAVAGTNKHNTSWGRTKAQQINLSDQSFLDLLNEAEVNKDYDIKITVINMEDFTYGTPGSSVRDDSGQHGGWYDSNYKENLSRDDLKDKYDMIIFGFADSYRDMEFNKSKIAKDIQGYIDAGKSVLFSHDLTSQINNTDFLKDEASTSVFMENTNGKGFNKYMRDAMGLDRYDQGRRVDTDEKQCTAYTKTGVGEKYGFTYTALMQYSNFRRNWNTGGKNQIEGWYGPYKNLYINLLARNNAESGNDAGKGWPYIGIPNDAASTPEDGDAYATRRVTLVNEGQITKYPFDLSQYKESDGTYKISTTHGQSYQLNMESEDVVCWFALSDKANGKGTGWYSASPNDAANNYYIYNKGNVTYTGVGHSTLGEMTEFEKRLFVNTMIAALRAGIEGPQPVITNGYKMSDGFEDRNVIYADVDTDSENQEFTRSENVEFYATDESTKNEWVYVSLEIEQEDGSYEELSLSGNKLVDKDGRQYKIVDSSGQEVLAENIRSESGTDPHAACKIKKTDLMSTSGEITYTIKYPREILKKQASQNFKITAYSYEKEGRYKIKGYQYGTLMRLSLFKLD